MSTSDQDMLLPPPPSAEQIRRREFATVRRGYDPEQVRTYLASVADQIELLERDLNQLRLEASSAAARGEQMADAAIAPPPAPPAEDPYEALSKRFAGLIETADLEAEKIITKARSEAQRALDEARGEADRIRVDAQSHAEEGRQEVADLLERATTEADRVLSTLGDRRRSLTAQLQEMRSKLISMADDLTIPLEEAEREERREVKRDEKEKTEVAKVADEDAEPPANRQQERVPLKNEEPLEIPEEAETSGEAEISGDAEKSSEAEDSRYEGLWVKQEKPLEIPDLASLDLHTEERDK